MFVLSIITLTISFFKTGNFVTVSIVCFIGGWLFLAMGFVISLFDSVINTLSALLKVYEDNLGNIKSAINQGGTGRQSGITELQPLNLSKPEIEKMLKNMDDMHPMKIILQQALEQINENIKQIPLTKLPDDALIEEYKNSIEAEEFKKTQKIKELLEERGIDIDKL